MNHEHDGCPIHARVVSRMSGPSSLKTAINLTCTHPYGHVCRAACDAINTEGRLPFLPSAVTSAFRNLTAVHPASASQPRQSSAKHAVEADPTCSRVRVLQAGGQNRQCPCRHRRGSGRARNGQGRPQSANPANQGRRSASSLSLNCPEAHLEGDKHAANRAYSQWFVGRMYLQGAQTLIVRVMPSTGKKGRPCQRWKTVHRTVGWARQVAHLSPEHSLGHYAMCAPSVCGFIAHRWEGDNL